MKIDYIDFDKTNYVIDLVISFMNKEKIFNRGLEFALEFGNNWAQPIQSRLSDKFPELELDELNSYDLVCRAAMNQGHDYVYKTLETAARGNGKINERQMAEELKSLLHKEYPWIDAENLKKILTRGYYYAWKDGLV